MKPICGKLIFKRLLYKLTTACTFHFNTKFVKKQMAAQWVEFCPLLYQISAWLRLPVHWSSRVPKRYKRNAVTGYLHRSKIISSNFQMEINVKKCKFWNADYPPKFINSVMHQFLTPNSNDLFIIPRNFFEESKLFVLVKIPYCEENKNACKDFIKKFEAFTNHHYRIAIKWITTKIKKTPSFSCDMQW